MNQAPATEEFARFIHLFDQMVLFTESWLDKMPPDKLDWVPIENASMRFGDRVSRITAKGLIIHMCVGDRHWIERIASCPSGGVIPVPKNPELEQQLASGDFRQMGLKLHEENIAMLKALTADDLNKTIVFADRTWTVMGFLWAMVTHRAFHLGNIDIYLRQSDSVAPDYFRFPAQAMV